VNISGWSVTEIKRGIPCKKCNGPAVLHLHLRFKYFDEVKSGVKRLEYRLSEKWMHKLDQGRYTHIRLYRGYQPVSEDTVLDFEYKGYVLQALKHEHFGPAFVLVCAIRLEKD
jgi:hypothetical protein